MPRILMLTVALALVVLTACTDRAGTRDGEGPTIPDPDATAGRSFRDLNGWVWFYTTAHAIRFTEITAMLDDLHDGGIRVIGIYTPYHGNNDKWLGAAPLDFYDVVPQSGTIEEFGAMVTAAHRRGMKVVTYFVNIYIDRESEFFRTAEQQYAAGDRSSPEVSAFRWADDDAGPLPVEWSDNGPEMTAAAGPSTWQYSDTAGAFYWSLWGEAGFDYLLPGARAELARVERFWLDIGLDGFMWDAGFVAPEFKKLMVDLPLGYTPNDKWLTFESTAAEDAGAYDEFGLTSWFNLEDDDSSNDYSRVAAGDGTADDLERGLANGDLARSVGKLTHAWSPWEGNFVAPYIDEERMRVQEAALLAGAGISYGVPNYTAFAGWPADQRANWERVLVTVNANAALWPSASRRRVATGPDAKSYAMLRTAEDGSQTALLVYNLKGEAAAVTVDLTGSGVAIGQNPLDLYSGGSVAEILGPQYELTLPPFGFAILQVEGG